MAKFYGKVGYADSQEQAPGVWRDVITERSSFGDVIKNTEKWRSNENLNDDLVLENRISIMADPYAYQHYSSIKYVEWMGALWQVTKVDVQRPRLILTIGGVYNGETPEASTSP